MYAFLLNTAPSSVRQARSLCAGVLMASLASAVAAQPQSQMHMPYGASANVVSLSASASVDVSNDWLSIVLSTSREGADANAVQAQLRGALEAALAEARKAARPGLLEVQTGAFSLYPRYAPPTRASNGAVTPGGLVGWQGNTELVLQGRDTAAITQLTGRIKTLTVERVGFSLSREVRDKVEADVTAQAITRFQERAAAVAKGFGLLKWSLREVSVTGDEPARPVMQTMMRAQAPAMAMADAPLPVEAGKAVVTISVSGTVQLQP